MRLAIIQTDGKGLRSLLEDVFYPSSPEWSPDGQWIAFIGSPAHGADPQLYLVRPDGSELTQLTFTDGFKNSLSWAPDGQAIVYSQTTGRAEQAEVDLFVYEMDTSSIRQLTDTPDANEFAPAYVPGGEAITLTNL
jgi:TolB protein